MSYSVIITYNFANRLISLSQKDQKIPNPPYFPCQKKSEMAEPPLPPFLEKSELGWLPPHLGGWHHMWTAPNTTLYLKAWHRPSALMDGRGIRKPLLPLIYAYIRPERMQQSNFNMFNAYELCINLATRKNICPRISKTLPMPCPCTMCWPYQKAAIKQPAWIVYNCKGCHDQVSTRAKEMFKQHKTNLEFF